MLLMNDVQLNFLEFVWQLSEEQQLANGKKTHKL